jgi:hypothetical protein
MVFGDPAYRTMSYAWAVWLYLLSLVPTAFASWIVGGAAINLVNRFPSTRYSSAWMVWAVNIVPAFLAGFLIFFMVTGVSVVRRHGDIAPHKVRAAPLYVSCGLLITYIVAAWRSPDWGFVAQLFEWPCAAFAGGIVGDLTGAAMYRRRIRRAEGGAQPPR